MSQKLVVILSGILALMLGATYITGNKSSAPSPGEIKYNDYYSLVGKPAPDFTLKDQSGNTFKLSSVRGKKVVLFFNEGIMCYPACWNQVAALGTDSDLNSAQTTTASIVVDQFGSWDSAIKKMPDIGKGRILFDTDKSVSVLYGMLSLPSSMHRGSMPGHTYVIVDGSGIIRYTKDDTQMGIRNQELVKQLNQI